MRNQVDKEDSDSNSLLKNDQNKKNNNETTDGQTKGVTQQDEADLKKKKYIKWGIIGAIILIIVILAIVLPITLSKNNDNPTPTPSPVGPNYNPYKVDEKDVVSETWGFKGYIYADQYSPSSHSLALEKLVGNIGNSSDVKLGVNLGLISVGDVNNKFIKNLSFSIAMPSWRVAHFTLTDAENSRFEIPEMSVPKPGDDSKMRLDMLGFQKSLNPFYFSFSDPTDTSNVFITTKDSTLVVLDKYIQMDFTLPSQRVFGFGERVREFQLQEGTWTMWSSGQNCPYDDGTGRLGVYGVHPFVMIQGKNKNDFIGMFFRNSNFQSPVLRYNDDKQTSTLSYITTGGILDIYFFIHGSAKDIIKSYQNYFGTPQLPPFWSLGWQQASYKWTNQSTVEEVIKNYTDNGFPLDTVYLDIPYMDNFVDFTVDTKNFPNLTDLATSLHNKSQHMVVIIDTGISAEDTTQKYYKQGNDDDVFIKSTISSSDAYGNNLVSEVWPKKAVFIDWFNDQCKNIWALGLTDLYNQTLFDGIWIDMNEPTTFIDGETVFNKTSSEKLRVDSKSLKQQRFLLQDTSSIDDNTWFKSFNQKDIEKEDTYFLPFIPRFNTSNNFDNRTLSLNATNKLGTHTQYDVHSLYGHMMTNRTHEFMTNNKTYANVDNRPFILTRSTFASSGRYASHWLGDNFRDWSYLRYSVAGIMNMNMFGIPHTGADVCGFFGTVREDEMCARWIQLGQFYPLARLHYNKDSDPNEPYLMNDTYKAIAKRAMLDRYSYLRHMYTCLFEAYKYGGSCFDPMFYSFPTDENVYTDMESTFIVGGALKVTPILKALGENETTMEAYFPTGTWVDINDGTYFAGNKTMSLSTTGRLNVHMKPGSIVSFQDNSDNKTTKTADLSSKPISLYVNRDDNGYASGSLFLDQGISLTELKDSTYEYYQFHLQSGSLNSLLTEGKRGTQNHVLDKIRIFNASDLTDYSACVLTVNLTTFSLQTSMPDVNTFDMIYSEANPLRFHDIHSIHFAKNLEETPCSINDVNYKLADADMPVLTANNATFNLSHSSGLLPNITVKLRLLQNEILNIQWTWADANNSKRMVFDIPQDIVATNNIPISDLTLADYVVITNTPYFQVNVTTRSSTTAVFSITNLLYDEYYNFIRTRAFTTKGIFGLGERANNDFFFKDGVYSMWNRDSGTPDESGKLPGNNMYGTHPFFMYKQASASWIGVFQKIANAQDWYIQNNSTTGTVDLNTITTGGVTDIYVMQDITPDKVVSQYFTIVGKPVLVPQWALGWNQCRYGYKTLDEVKAVVQGYANYSIPLDVQWSDIDYLNEYRNFEYDQVSYNGLPAFVDSLHAKNMRYVPIIDAGLAYRIDGSYSAFTDGVNKNVFMKINADKEIFIAQVWPGDAAFPDYFAPNTNKWWQDNLSSLYKTIKFDGLWEDMNEASNFCAGICYDKQKPISPIQQKLKYIPTGRDLEQKSMSLDAQHANGFYQLDTHSLYGAQMSKASSDWFTSQGMRTFIIERSSISGSGKYASRWLGDNESKWEHMPYSITGVMLMNMFGMTMVGSDICGFGGNTNAELCTKWHLVGAFYPFSRNHNGGQTAQEPYVWANSTVNGQNATNVMRDAIKIKYSLIRYYYSNLFSISTSSDTATLFKPMFFEFPEDDNAYNDIVYNFMLGDSIKVSINPSTQGLATKDYYFPAGLWCAINGTGITIGTCFTSPAAGGTQTFQADDTDYQYHLREGKIVPLQDTQSMTFSTSVDLQGQPVDLHVLGTPDETNATNWFASGVYINDDGVSLNYTGKYNKYLITASVTQTTNLTVKFTNTTVALNQKFSTVANCSAVNKNDYLSKMYFYNADAFNLKTAMSVKAFIYPDEVNLVDVGTAAYDDATKRLVFTASYNTETSICMSTIKELQFSFV